MNDLVAHGVHAWFGSRMVLEDVDLEFPHGSVTALIGPSGCGKSTFIRTLNRMHEFVPSAQMAGRVELGGDDIYAPGTDVTKIRLKIGMVFQKPNPFPSMTIRENVLSGPKLAHLPVANKDELVETSLVQAGLWKEVKDRLNEPAVGLSGGQQQRLCIARSLAVNPQVLLMDEPCSALDPGSTLRVEETISELKQTITVVIVTHNMQQAGRVSDRTAFFTTEVNPESDRRMGRLVEFDDDDQRVLRWPENEFRLARFPGGAHDLVLLSGVEPHLRYATYADAIMDRLVHNAHRIELAGDSMRRTRAKQSRKA